MNTNPAIEDGDEFEIEAKRVPIYHAHDACSGFVDLPALKFKRWGIHAIAANEATRLLLDTAHSFDKSRRQAEIAE